MLLLEKVVSKSFPYTLGTSFQKKKKILHQDENYFHLCQKTDFLMGNCLFHILLFSKNVSDLIVMDV